MPIVDESAVPDGEISDGEALYSAMALVFSESKPEDVMAAALAIQQGGEWVELSPGVRSIFDDIAEELFDEDDDGEAEDEDEAEEQTA